MHLLPEMIPFESPLVSVIPCREFIKANIKKANIKVWGQNLVQTPWFLLNVLSAISYNKEICLFRSNLVAHWNRNVEYQIQFYETSISIFIYSYTLYLICLFCNICNVDVEIEGIILSDTYVNVCLKCPLCSVGFYNANKNVYFRKQF